MSEPTLKVAVAVSLDDASAERIVTLEPRIELLRDPALTRPWRWTGDWEGDPAWQRSPEQQEAFDTMIDGADALFGLPDVSPAALARTVRANPSLRWLHTTAAGGGGQVKNAQLTEQELERVVVTTSAGMHASTLAEWAVFGVLAGAKGLRRLEADQASRTWGDGRRLMRHVSEMTVLVVGLGGIGAVVAERFSALGATVWGTTRSGKPVEHVDRLVPMDELVEAAAQVDAIVTTLPGTTHTTGLIGEAVLGAVQPDTILVNVGRGAVVDEPALLDALDDGRIGFAALDVTAVEPLPTDSRIWEHPSVLLSPHTAALSVQEPRRIAELFAANATRLLDGQPLHNVMSTKEFY
ncbi:D-2-hydroxyacid dehydrogenase [Agrococcus sp. ARC_14]|uniref:D-2-hydroxyacid dehydrogenase n=1 Tax=Agrococcus sp. ARC_14 TaxID=2919927 RepID=UPI001F06D3A4|nr:D-2-hydroxyacid dehydrogenase [Agrococcus sp. ARC_14]MCH1882370.1 D-2-hydroxyacid dehydrogenase [Agrococcus sp. ARC_14]